MHMEENNGRPEGTQRPNMCRPRCNPGNNDSGLGGNLALAMAYVPMQAWRQLYEADEALENGTLFRELNFPFLGLKKGDQDE